MEGIDGLFFVLPANPAQEVSFAANILDSAREKGIKHLVYSSVARTGSHEDFPGWSNDYPMAWYWLNKAEIEQRVREAGFASWTILRPAFFMSNFCQPDCSFMFPELAEGHELRSAFRPETRLHLVDVADIARFAAASFDGPAEFAGKTIPLASEALTLDEIANNLSEVAKEVKVVYLTEDDAQRLKAEGRVVMDAQIWQRDVGYNVDLEAVKSYGITLTSFSGMLRREGLGW